jgi:curved DNA-binding protein CbpA
MNTKKDYYAILGILPIAEDIVIRAAYKALAQRYHPDRCKDDIAAANKILADLNEAYSILSDAEKRRRYDNERGKVTQSSDSYFATESDDFQPEYDPLEEDWIIARKFYPDLPEIESQLCRISWRLAYSFRAYLLEEKKFESRYKVAISLERQFLEIYFGTNPRIINFAKKLIDLGHKKAAKSLNEAIRIFGDNVDAERIRQQITKEFNLEEKLPSTTISLHSRAGLRPSFDEKY